MPDSTEYVFGANILDNLTTGMYTDSRVIFREYIQNACDSIDIAEKTELLKQGQGIVDIYTNDSQRSITIRDNGTGISASDFRKILGRIASSDKMLGESKGFRGIGRLCGLAYCETVVFSTKACGEDTVSFMKCNAKLMRELIQTNQSQKDLKLTAAEVLEQIVSYEVQKTNNVSEHWFEVKLINVNEENHDLLAKESVIDYLSFISPVPYNKNFSYRSRIYEYIKTHKYKLSEYVIKVNGEQIFKDYRTHVKTSKGEDHIFDVQFHELYDENGEVIAWMWYGLRGFQAVIENDCLQRSLRLRKENIQIGDEDALRHLFKEQRGTHYFIGEVHAISKDLIPNSQRDYFNETPMRNTFEREAKMYFTDTLYPLYHAGNGISSAVAKIDSYNKQLREFEEKKNNGDFIDKRQQKQAASSVEKAKNVAVEAQKSITKLLDKHKGNSDSPIYKVVTRIAGDRDSNTVSSIDNDDNKDEVNNTSINENQGDENSQTGKKNKKTEYWTDRLHSASKSQRDLIRKVINIVNDYVDDETMDKILKKIEEKFK